jgi:hypothetical protein
MFSGSSSSARSSPAVVAIIIALAGRRLHAAPAGGAVPDDHAGAGDGQRDYPGADSKTLADSVASPIEQQINGVDKMLYMSSTSSSTGQLTMTVYFSLDTDPDIAPGAGAEPREPRDAAAAVRRRAAGRQRAEEVVVDHDAGRGLCEERPLQRELHRELRERVRSRRAEARSTARGRRRSSACRTRRCGSG